MSLQFDLIVVYLFSYCPIHGSTLSVICLMQTRRCFMRKQHKQKSLPQRHVFHPGSHLHGIFRNVGGNITHRDHAHQSADHIFSR